MFDATKLLKWRVSKYNPNAVEIVGFDKEAVPEGEKIDLTIPQKIVGKKVVAIGNMAFEDCSSLSSIVLPEGLKTIGEDAFYGCSLSELQVSSENRYFQTVDGVLFSKDGKELIAYPSGRRDERYVVPDSVKSIGSSAFSGCSSLNLVALPDGVKSIGSSVFYGCSSLNSIALPDGLETIGEWAFSGCSSLNSIALPDGVKSIGFGTFFGCSSLSSIVLPEGLKTIGHRAFWRCSSLSSIALPDGLKTIGVGAFKDCPKNCVFIAPRGSYAQRWAIEKGFRVQENE